MRYYQLNSHTALDIHVFGDLISFHNDGKAPL